MPKQKQRARRCRRGASSLPLLCSALLAFAFLILPPSPRSKPLQFVSAHRRLTTRPSCGIDYGSSETALPVHDPTISWSFKHYLDCTHRAIWMKLVGPAPDFQFYLGVGIPTLDRLRDLRADAVVIGPGLPAMSEEERRREFPEEVANDALWRDVGEDVGALLFRGPEDQSTCDHLGTVMMRSSTVRNGRCDFYEPFGSTHSWRVLDADEINLPVQGGEYYAAVFLREHTSGKVGIALGTWVENFWRDIPIDTPSCVHDLADFDEKGGDRSEEFPVVRCATAPETTNATGEMPPAVGVVSNATFAEGEPCERGRVCADGPVNCTVAGVTYRKSTVGACGGRCCPAAAQKWEEVNVKMHEAMTIEYTGDPQIDFVRGMIPHHAAGVDMCHVLIDDLTCVELSDVDALDGLVQFCGHLYIKQETEMDTMQQWLIRRGLDAEAPCPTTAMLVAEERMGGGQMAGGNIIEGMEREGEEGMDQSERHGGGNCGGCDGEEGTGHSGGHSNGNCGGHGGKEGVHHSGKHGGGNCGGCGGEAGVHHSGKHCGRNCGGHRGGHINRNSTDDHDCSNHVAMNMSFGCGNLMAPSSLRFTDTNERMHGAMAIKYSCNHTVDFARMMIPHHAGAVLMCDALLGSSLPGGDPIDPFLAELCSNITATQRAEIAWLHRWLDGRGHSAYASCAAHRGRCPDGSEPVPPPEEAPCEDVLPESGFCHFLKEDAFCRCETALTVVASCEEGASSVDVKGMGQFEATAECARSCGLCPEESPPLLYVPCPQINQEQQSSDADCACGGSVENQVPSPAVNETRVVGKSGALRARALLSVLAALTTAAQWVCSSFFD